VSAGRLRSGELLAAAGTVVLLVSLFLQSPGWLALALAVIAAGTGCWLVVANLADRPVTQVVGAGVLGATAGPVAVVALLVDRAWLGLAGAAVLTAGAFRALGDERTDVPENAYEPPPARPTPSARAS
jgi:hypothetical protein